MQISVRGAREHNLQGVDLDLPRERLLVFCGPSGSGKSSLAFDTLHAESQRRFVEALSGAARSHFGATRKPAFDLLTGLTPSLGVAQRGHGSPHPRATVGSLVEVQDLLRVLWARTGRQHCPRCDADVTPRSVDAVLRELCGVAEGTRMVLCAPVARGRTGSLAPLLAALGRQGFARVRVDGAQYALDEVPALDASAPHDVDVVIDRVKWAPDKRDRVQEAVATALATGQGALVAVLDDAVRAWSTRARCVNCQLDLPELTTRLLSATSPVGACPSCQGLGTTTQVDLDRLVADPARSLADGALDAWTGAARKLALAELRRRGVDVDAPWSTLPWEQRNVALYGDTARGAEEGPPPRGRHWMPTSGGGVGRSRSPAPRRLPANAPFPRTPPGAPSGPTAAACSSATPPPETAVREAPPTGSRGTPIVASPDHTPSAPRFEGAIAVAERKGAAHLTRVEVCAACNGARLSPAARAVRVAGIAITEVLAQPLAGARRWLATLPDDAVTAPIVEEAGRRLDFLLRTGLGYVSLDRRADTLSGGELQRVRLAAQAGHQLSGVLYVLDEPTAGLHPDETTALLGVLTELRDAGNTVLVVEHDAAVIAAADHVVDFGPGAGVHGGRVVYAGTPAGLLAADTATGRWLSGRERIPAPVARTPRGTLRLQGARGRNLQDLDVRFPLGTLCGVAGPSGSGKSTLVEDTLARALEGRRDALPYDTLTGREHVTRLVRVDASPLGRSARSNPATVTKAWDTIRQLLSRTPEAKLRGFGPERFSLAVPGGRCEACGGEGARRVEMQLLPDVVVPCEICEGKRFDEATLAVTWQGFSAADLLALPVARAREVFAPIPAIAGIFSTMEALGLGYLQLGQGADTLSGGEAQRVKLARELGKPGEVAGTLYVLDEPSVGLHPADIALLVEALRRLVDHGGSVIVVEHDTLVLDACDHVLRMGPGAGPHGGKIV